MKYTKISTKQTNMQEYQNIDNSMDGEDQTNGRYKYKEQVITNKLKAMNLLSYKTDNLDNIYFMNLVNYFSFLKELNMK